MQDFSLGGEFSHREGESATLALDVVQAYQDSVSGAVTLGLQQATGAVGLWWFVGWTYARHLQSIA